MAREADPGAVTAPAETRADGLLILAASSADPDLAPWLGLRSRLGTALLWWPREGRPRLAYSTPMEREEAAHSGLPLLPPEESSWARRHATAGEAAAVAHAAQCLLEGASPRPRCVGLAGRPPAGWVLACQQTLAAAGFRSIDGTRTARHLRKAKTAAHLEHIRAIAAALCGVYGELARDLVRARARDSGFELDGEPVTCGHLRRRIAVLLAARELEQPEGNIVAVGADAGVPHSRSPDERRPGPGEPLLIDLFPRRGLFADCTRTWVLGEPPAAVREAHKVVLAALQQAYDGVRPGARGQDLQDAACAHFERAGYPTLRTDSSTERGFVHGLGHGVGFELHEEPSFRERGPGGCLEVGDVFTLEPGLYDPAAGWGVRVEDTVWLGADGIENLTPLPRDLDPRACAAWRQGSAMEGQPA